MTLPDNDQEYDELIIALALMYYFALYQGANSGAEQVGQSVNIDEGLMLIAFESVDALMSAVNETTIQRASTIVSEWNGESREELNALLEPVFSEARASSIAITENTRAFQIGNIAAWGALGLALEGVLWHTQEDDRVCPICSPRNNIVFEVGVDNPPAHVGCRCWTSPAIRI